MPPKVQHKRSAVPGKVPTTARHHLSRTTTASCPATNAPQRSMRMRRWSSGTERARNVNVGTAAGTFLFRLSRCV